MCAPVPGRVRQAPPATRRETRSRGASPVQAAHWVTWILGFHDLVAFVRSGRPVDVPRFVEIAIEPSPDILGEALLHDGADASATYAFHQCRTDIVERQFRVARRRVRTQRRWAGGTWVCLVFGAAHISRCAGNALGYLAGWLGTDCMSLSSFVPHVAPASITINVTSRNATVKRPQRQGACQTQIAGRPQLVDAADTIGHRPKRTLRPAHRSDLRRHPVRCVHIGGAVPAGRPK